MARIRSIKPEFWTSQTLSRVSPLARLLFIATWTHADDVGHFQAAPALLASQAFPMDGFTPPAVDALIGELEMAGLIRLYAVAGNQYGEVSNWGEHQVINRPSDKRLPEPNEHDFTEPSVRTHGALTEDSPLEGEGEGEGEREREGEREGSGETHLSSDERSTVASKNGDDVGQVWAAYQVHHPQSVLTDKRRKLIRARLKEGRTPADLVAAIEGCHASEFHMGGNDRHRRFDTIELIMRDAGKVEDFMQMWREPAGRHTVTGGEILRAIEEG